MPDGDADESKNGETGAPAQPVVPELEKPSLTPPMKTGIISGTVSGKAGDALAEATVFAKKDDKTAGPVLTASDGSYTLVDLEAGQWQVFAWHQKSESAATGVTQVTPGTTAELKLVTEAGANEFKVSGTVFYHYGDKAVPRAVVKATRKLARGAAGEPLVRSAVADGSGDFTLDNMQPGVWSFIAFDEKSTATVAEERTVWGSTNRLRLQVWRTMTDDEARLGWRFLGGLVAAVFLLVVFYALAHSWTPRGAQDMSDVLIGVSDQILASSKPLTVTAELTATVGSLRSTWETVSNTVTSLAPSAKQMFSQVVSDVQDAFAARDMSALEQRVRVLNTLAKSSFFSTLFWTREPLRYVEVLLWALAGILINLIITIAGYLRFQRFYRDGIPLHLAQIAAVPVMALVFVLLVSQVSVTLSIAGTNDVHVDLSDPRLLAALSFLIGVAPWGIWNFIQERAARLTA